MKTEKLATINNVSIICLKENEQKLIPIRPICEALGVDYEEQLESLNDKEGNLATLGGKPILVKNEQGEDFYCLSIEFAIGWMPNIEPLKTPVQNIPLFIERKRECFKAVTEFCFAAYYAQLNITN